MDYAILVKITTSAPSIVRFIEGGEIVGMLDSIGQVEFKAAKLAFENARESEDPRSEVWLAVGHLQSAYIAFRDSTIKNMKSFEGRYYLITKYMYLASMACVACCLMAICYYYLGEKRSVVAYSELALNPVDPERDAGYTPWWFDSQEDNSSSDTHAAIAIFTFCVNPHEWYRIYQYRNRIIDESIPQSVVKNLAGLSDSDPGELG